jgi:hypothetical protein
MTDLRYVAKSAFSWPAGLDRSAHVSWTNS